MCAKCCFCRHYLLVRLQKKKRKHTSYTPHTANSTHLIGQDLIEKQEIRCLSSPAGTFTEMTDAKRHQRFHHLRCRPRARTLFTLRTLPHGVASWLGGVRPSEGRAEDNQTYQTIRSKTIRVRTNPSQHDEKTANEPEVTV